MSRWFRLHDEILNDPKVQRLDGETFKAWINLLCLTSQNGGRLPPVEDISFALRVTPDAVSTVLTRLLNGGLIVARSGGADGMHYAPHKWEERQYKSDTSTQRVKRFRERSKTVTETAPDTDTDTEVSVAKATAPEVDSDKLFWSNAKAYLKPYVKGDPGSLIGKWAKEHGKPATAEAITRAQLDRPVNPIEYVQGIFRKAAANGYPADHSGVPL